MLTLCRNDRFMILLLSRWVLLVEKVIQASVHCLTFTHDPCELGTKMKSYISVISSAYLTLRFLSVRKLICYFYSNNGWLRNSESFGYFDGRISFDSCSVSTAKSNHRYMKYLFSNLHKAWLKKFPTTGQCTDVTQLSWSNVVFVVETCIFKIVMCRQNGWITQLFWAL